MLSAKVPPLTRPVLRHTHTHTQVVKAMGLGGPPPPSPEKAYEEAQQALAALTLPLKLQCNAAVTRHLLLRSPLVKTAASGIC